MEVELRLDGQGRTTCASNTDTEDAKEDTGQTEKSANVLETPEIDYTPKVTMTSTLVTPSAAGSPKEAQEQRTWMDNILFDCEVSISC